LIGADAPPEGGLALDPTNLRADHAGFLLGLTAGLATELRAWRRNTFRWVW